VSRLGKRSSTEKSEKTRRCSGRCDRRRRRASGIASRHHDRLLLPRYIDTADHTDAEFRAWLTGIATFLPTRRQAETVGQFVEEPAAS
jgi:hypothetical protein